MLNQDVFKDGMKELMLAFNMDLQAEQIKIWYKYCKKYSDKDFKKKVTNCIKFCRHKPYIADLLDIKEKDEFSPANAGAYKLM